MTMDSVTTSPHDHRRCHVLGVPVDACRDVQAAALGLHANGGGTHCHSQCGDDDGSQG
jgi:N-acetylglucosaminyldiphosphoundecaprenol N-acetyl-beta-D-mannosaminyltransferase